MRLFSNQSIKWLFVAIVMAFGATQAEANPVDVTAAKAVATQFMANKASQGKFMTSSVNLKLTHTELSNIDKVTPAYYLFTNDDGNGWVFISADDRAKQVLGYGLSGTLEFDNIPCNMRYWLNEYRQQIEYLQQHPEIQPGPKMQAKSRVTISPLLNSVWGQDKPFNNECPSKGLAWLWVKAPTGCGATAMAQIMYKHKYPQQTSLPIPAYVTKTNGFQMPLLPETTFKWDKMINNYANSHDSENEDAVAELMLYCGQSVNMDYDINGSSSELTKIFSALTLYYGYDNSIKFLKHDAYSETTWEQLIYTNLMNGLPIIYRGANADNSSNHFFIIDGYKDGLYHINWGWDGNYQTGEFSYWELSALTPESHDYSYGQYMITDIKPDDGIVSPEVSVNSISWNGMVNSTRTTPFQYRYEFINSEISTIIVGMGLVNRFGDLVRILRSSEYIPQRDGFYPTFDNVTIPSDVANGYYEIKPFYKFVNSSTWQEMPVGDESGTLQAIVTDGYVKYGFIGPNEEDISVNINDLTWVIDGILMQVDGLTISDVTWIVDAALGHMHDDNKPTRGLVAYYPFNGNADDASGCGNHGTPSGGVSLTSGVTGDANGAYQFGGYDNPGHIRVPNSESLKFSDGCTFAGYIKFNSWISMDGWGYRVASGGNQCFIAKSHDRHGISFIISGNDEIIRFGVGTYSNSWAIIGYEYPGYHLNQWIHFAITYGNGYARMYINGQSVSEIETTPNFSTVNTQDMYIGKFSDYWYPFNGVIDEVRVYNRPLSAQEVRSLLVQ